MARRWLVALTAVAALALLSTPGCRLRRGKSGAGVAGSPISRFANILVVADGIHAAAGTSEHNNVAPPLIQLAAR